MNDRDPYEALGVPRDATPEQIRSAHRRKAMANHSDRGGSDAVMAMINRARDVLIDPERRARFDRTGQAEKIQSGEAKAREVIMSLLLQALEDAPDDALIIASVRVNIEEQATELDLQARKVTKTIAKIERHSKRFKRPKASEGDFVSTAIAKRLQLRRAELERIDRDRAAAAIALKLLEGYSDDAPPDLGTFIFSGIPGRPLGFAP